MDAQIQILEPCQGTFHIKILEILRGCLIPENVHISQFLAEGQKFDDHLNIWNWIAFACLAQSGER